MERLVNELEVVTLSKSLTDERLFASKRTLARAVADYGWTIEAGTGLMRSHTPVM
jgi:hypothetical protein